MQNIFFKQLDHWILLFILDTFHKVNPDLWWFLQINFAKQIFYWQFTKLTKLNLVNFPSKSEKKIISFILDKTSLLNVVQCETYFSKLLIRKKIILLTSPTHFSEKLLKFVPSSKNLIIRIFFFKFNNKIQLPNVFSGIMKWSEIFFWGWRNYFSIYHFRIFFQGKL